MKVYCNGVYDLFHEGHLHYFEESSKLGELYVGIHSDEDAQLYKRTPLLTYDERCKLVAGCKYVKGVIPDTKLEITEDFIKSNQIDIVVVSEVDERWHADPVRMGIIKVIPRYEGLSTTILMERFLDRVKTSLKF